MLSNHLLDMKNKTQKKLFINAGYDVIKYMENLHTISSKIEKEHGIILQYVNMNNVQPITDKPRIDCLSLTPYLTDKEI